MLRHAVGMEALLSGLPTLLMLSRAGSLTAAAARLGVPRSTVSRRLARLEQHLGVALADRNTRSFKLTAAAQRLVAEAGSLLAQLETISEVVRADAGEVRGQLRLATPPGLGGAFVGSFLARFQRQFPRVDVELVVTERRPHLIAERFDVLLATELPPDLPWTRRALGQSRLVAVASRAYLRGRPALESPDDLAAHVTLSGPRKEDGLLTWPRLRGAPLPVKPAFVTNDYPTLRVAALEGLGIALLPVHLVFDELASGALVQVLPKHLGAPLDVYALHAPERRNSPVLRAFFASLTKYVGELVGA
ncbi:MAG: LysR family transcriptional regulator [Myxococcota bacterium]